MTSKKWYAIYVKSRTEKKVNQLLLDKGIETYLPLVKTLRQWADRKKLVEVPLLSSYIFVHTAPVEFTNVQATIGVVKFVKFENVPVPIPEKQIQSLQLLLNAAVNFEITFDELTIGDEVVVFRGPLKGFTGYIASYKGKQKVILHIGAVNQSLMVEIDPKFLKKSSN